VLLELANPAAPDVSNGGPRKTDTPFASQSAGGSDRWVLSDSELIEPGGGRKLDAPVMRSAESIVQWASPDVLPTISLLDDREARLNSQRASESPTPLALEDLALVRDRSKGGPELVLRGTPWIENAQTDEGSRRMDLLDRFLATASVTAIYVVLGKVRSALSRSSANASRCRPLLRQ
jgi:hypothetical protein